MDIVQGRRTSFLINASWMITSISPDAPQEPLIRAPWKGPATSLSLAEASDGNRLCAALRNLANADRFEAASQMMRFQAVL